MHEHQRQRVRLKSRKSFIDCTEELSTTPKERRLNLWKNSVPHSKIEPLEEGSLGLNLTFGTWKSLNRLRTAVTRCKSNLLRWGFAENELCECGAKQDYNHLLICPNMTKTCTRDDIFSVNDEAIYVANYWSGKV